MKRKFGKANHCENPQCDHQSKYYNWALVKGKRYEIKRENFIQLCKKCHYHYDEINLKQKPKSLDTKRKISQSNKGKTAWNKNKTWSKQIKNKIHLSLVGKFKGSLNPMYGRKHSKHALKLMSQKRIAYFQRFL